VPANQIEPETPDAIERRKQVFQLLTQTYMSHGHDHETCAALLRDPKLRDAVENVATVLAALSHALGAASEDGRADSLGELANLTALWLCEQRITVAGASVKLGTLALTDPNAN
jgi:hypothetical protein